MRARAARISLCIALAASAASAHGPHIQITNDSGKITTRQLFQDGPYASVSAPKSVYVIPLREFSGAWLTRPNDSLLAGVPEFPSGPGLAYGSDLADGGPQAFATGSVLSVGFLDGLKHWNGAAFVDAGATELKAFRGSNVNISTPAANFAVTTDAAPFDSVSLATVAENYHSEGAEVHGSFRWALLGDGTSPTSSSADGVYLLKLQLSSTQNGLAPSDPYYFVLHKNASSGHVAAAIASLQFAPDLVQVVPEPGTALLVAAVVIGFALMRQSSRH